MKGLSPTQRTLAALRDRGMLCAIVERHVSKIGKFGKRFDAFGFIDIIALDPERHAVVGIQSCGVSFSEHLKKLTEDCYESARAWIACGGIIEVWGWRKVKRFKGGRQMVKVKNR